MADLRSVYGETPKIILMNGYGWDINEPANYSHEVADELGDPNLSVCLFPWLWEQWHGSQWDHSGQAYVLLDHITGLNPDWKQLNPGDIIDGFGRNWDFANGGFEHSAPFGGFGWRYLEDGVERVYNPDQAAEGAYYIRLEEGEEVHQPTDATGDFLPGASSGGETFYVTSKIRGAAEGAKAQIVFDFQGQQIWARGNAQSTSFDLTTEWDSYIASFIPPAGTWTLFTSLKSASGVVEFDSVSMGNVAPGGIATTGSSGGRGEGCRIFPHPISDESVLKFLNSGKQQVTVQIFNSSCSLMKAVKTATKQISLSASEFGQGLYLFRILTFNDYPYMGGTFIVN